MGNRRVVWAWLFYGGLTVLLVGVLVQLWPEVLPGGVARRIGRNSEGYLMALVLAGWIQFVRPRLAGTAREWPVTLAAALVALLIGAALLATDLPSRFRTLNEAFIALAVVIPYVQYRRPISQRTGALLGLGCLVVIVAGNQTDAVTDLAEALGLLILVPIGFDVVDRAILAPGERTSTMLRWSWYAFLVMVPTAMSVLQPRVDLGAFVDDSLRYGVRITESFIAMLLVAVYFAVALGRTGDSTGPATTATADL